MSRPKRLVWSALLAVALLVAWAIRDWGGPGPATSNVTVEISTGASLATAARSLAAAGAIRSAWRFRLWTHLFGGRAPIHAGDYRVPAGLSQADVLKMLQGGKTIQHFVTIPEGFPSVLVQEALMKAPQLQGPVAMPLEGSVLPDSYSYNRGDQRQAVLERMQRAMTDYLAQAWAKRKPGLVVQTPEEALILASIVEKETGKADERPMVAAVFSNRLRLHMRLQADSTIIYPITMGRPLGRRILRSEIATKNGFNTYAMDGLPVGPICNPGRASIDAVLDPANSKALYFVADGSGGHVFADTLEQHNANVQKWYALRRERGEM